MNVKPLILAAALGLALNAHAAPKAKTVKKSVKPVAVQTTDTETRSDGVRLSDGIAAIADNWRRQSNGRAEPSLKAHKSAIKNYANKFWRNSSTNP